MSVFQLADPLAVVAPLLRAHLTPPVHPDSRVRQRVTVHTTITDDYDVTRDWHVFLSEVEGTNGSTNGPMDAAQMWSLSIDVTGPGRDETRNLALSCRSIVFAEHEDWRGAFTVVQSSYPIQAGVTRSTTPIYRYLQTFTLLFAAV